MFKRISPDRWLSRRAADSVTLSQDVIEICGEIFELTFKVDSVANPGYTDPAVAVVRSLHVWDAQRATVQELYTAKMELAKVLARLRKIEGKEFQK